MLQNGTLFAGDILTNIVGSGLYTYEDAWEAVKACGMEDDIDQMPMGLHRCSARARRRSPAGSASVC